MKNAKFTLSAKILRIILFLAMFLLLVAAAAGFFFATNHLRGFTQNVNALEAKASAGNADLSKLATIQSMLVENATVIEKTHKIVAESKSYQYQDEIIKDIRRYADKAGIPVTGFSFSGSDAVSSSSPPAAAANGNSGTAATTPGAGTSALPSTIKTTSVSVAIPDSISYNKLMRFVQYIETNATKMQIKNISMTHNTEDGAKSDKVSTGALEIEVYVR